MSSGFTCVAPSLRSDLLTVLRLSAAICSLIFASCDQFARVGVMERGDVSDGEGGGRDGGGGQGEESGHDGGSDASDVPAVMQLDDCGPDNPARLSPESVATLLKGGSSEPLQRFLYPYEGTVFPGGLMPPLVMWDGPASDAVLLRLRSRTFAYTGCLPVAAAGQVAIPERAWAALQAANGADDAVELELTALDKGRARGPIKRTFKVAPVPRPFSIYYMGYDATAAIYRLRLGQPAERVSGPNDCSGCHALNPRGTRLLDYAKGSGAVQCIDSSATMDPPAIRTQLPGAEFGALTPDGSLYVAPAHPPNFGTRALGIPVSQTALVDVTSGTMLSGHNIPSGATVPAFSSDGTRLAFNDFAIASGRGLALMDFDLAARAAGNYREIYRDPVSYPGWPSFVQGTRRIVFARGTTRDFSANGAYVSPGSIVVPPASDLYSVEIDGGEASLLARAMGFSARDAADADSYLPFLGEDLHKNYYPQVAPFTAGRYAFVFFDSIRHYGNLGSMRQIWGAAVDLASEVDDPSHPPFYVSGQNATTINLRAVAALDPEPNGVYSCTSGGGQ